MSEVQVGSKKYVIGKVDTFSQLHLARKLGPSIPIIAGLIDHNNAEKNKDLLTVLMLSHVGDADAEFVVRKCMSVIHRRDTDGKPCKVQAADGTMMFDDISLSEMMELTVKVIEENLGDFFRTALASMETQMESPT